MGYRANVDGCYIAWSPVLHEAYRFYYPDSRFTLAKIGSSGDVFSRMDSLNGLESYFSKVKAKPHGHANTSDWVPWRIKQDKENLTRLQLERRIQDRQPRLGRDLWESVHKRVSSRPYAPNVQEIFIVEIDRIDSILPTIIHDIVPQLRGIDQHLSAWFREDE